MSTVNQKFRQLKDNGFINILKNILSCKFLPFFTAAVFLLCYYAAWDLFAAYYIALLCVVMLLLLDDLSPIISNFLFMAVIVSKENSPSKFFENHTPSDFYTRPYVTAQLGVIIGVICIFLIYRLIRNIAAGKFKLTPVFYGLAVFAAVLLFNGVFSKDYKPMNLVYGLCLAGLFFGIFAVLKDSIVWNGETMKNISYAFIAFGVLICIEVACIYLTSEDIVSNGVVNRQALGLGWGMYNTIGAYLIICAPFPFYLATRYKHGYLFYLLGLVFLGTTVLTFSRQAWGGAAAVYSTCVLALITYEKGLNKRIVIIITAAICAIALIFAFVFWNQFITLVKNLFRGIFSGSEFTGNGRKSLWELAWSGFKSSPVFGVGFFGGADKVTAPDFDGLAFIPEMYHNTFMQLLGSCGIIALLAYVVHRIQTVICFLKNVTFERLLIVISGAGLLLVNLVDNHLFYLYPTLIYSCLVAMLVKSETDGEKGLNFIPQLKTKKTEEQTV